MRRILAARLDSLGDVVLTGPAVRALAASSDQICLLAGPKGADAARLLPGVHDVSVLHAPWIDHDTAAVDRASVDRAVAQLESLGCDEAVIFTSAYQSPLPLAMLLRMAGVPRIAGISVAYPGSLLDVCIREDLDVHEVERGLSLARAAGFALAPGDDGSLQMSGRHDEPAVDAGFVLLHPGGTAPARRWSEQRWTALALELVRRGHRIVVTGTEAEHPLAARIVEAITADSRRTADGVALDLTGRTTLAGLIAHIAAARCIVVANTGPAHLAAAAGTPVVSLFAPTVPARRWRPWRVAHVLLGDQTIGCAGCRAVACPVDGHPCLETVTPDDAARAVEVLLAQSAPSPVGVSA
jgi:ADP-heptose:LPS heptosyltransferase